MIGRLTAFDLPERMRRRAPMLVVGLALAMAAFLLRRPQTWFSSGLVIVAAAAYRRTALALRDRRERLGLAIEAAGVGVCDWRPEGLVCELILPASALDGPAPQAADSPSATPLTEPRARSAR